MRITARTLFAPLVATFVLALVLNVTMAALGTSGAWRRFKPAAGSASASPYAALDRVLARRGDPIPAALRNPFGYGGAGLAVTAPAARPRRPQAPPPPLRPVLTSIIWGDSDPRATIRWNGRDYSVRPSALFDEFRVVSITRNQVVLDRGGESLVLRLSAEDR